MYKRQLPIFFITLFEKDGLTFEKYFKHIYLHKFYQPKKRVRKEVYLEQEKKNSANKTHAKRKGIEKSKAGLKEKMCIRDRCYMEKMIRDS